MTFICTHPPSLLPTLPFPPLFTVHFPLHPPRGWVVIFIAVSPYHLHQQDASLCNPSHPTALSWLSIAHCMSAVCQNCWLIVILNCLPPVDGLLLCWIRTLFESEFHGMNCLGDQRLSAPNFKGDGKCDVDKTLEWSVHSCADGGRGLKSVWCLQII